jgi:diadenosine tetraphosphate (Ap4A) HIT family hydrolase
MSLIFETDNYLVEAPDQPLVTRTDGGHITITPKKRLTDRTQLEPTLAIELMFLTMLTGDAMTKGLRQRGIDIGRINYQDNGNWGVFKPEGPYLHYHLYGRAKNAVFHKYGEACSFPFRDTGVYDNFERLNEEDIKAIQDQTRILLAEHKYQSSHWNNIHVKI